MTTTKYTDEHVSLIRFLFKLDVLKNFNVCMIDLTQLYWDLNMNNGMGAEYKRHIGEWTIDIERKS
jgi:hypothetical protein